MLQKFHDEFSHQKTLASAERPKDQQSPAVWIIDPIDKLRESRLVAGLLSRVPRQIEVEFLINVQRRWIRTNACGQLELSRSSIFCEFEQTGEFRERD